MIDTSSIPAVATSLIILGTFSAATWGLGLFKLVQQLRVARHNRQYAKRFWSATNLQAAADLPGEGPYARLARTGFEALQPSGASSDYDLEHSWDRHELLERNLRQQIQKERRRLEAGLVVLATVGSTAPFVGLFGTVWGIMNAMRRIGTLGNVSIDAVAGPIGEALVATGIGIAVAIPAVLGYNFLLRRAKTLTADLDDFSHDFVNLAQRAAFRVLRTESRALELAGDARREPRAAPEYVVHDSARNAEPVIAATATV